MRARWARFTAAAALTVAAAGGGVVLTAGDAAAATPIIVGSCATSIQGAPGTPVELSPSAVVGMLGPLSGVIPGLQGAFAGLPPIPIGALPTGSGNISGSQIAGAVMPKVTGLIGQIPVLGAVLVDTLTGNLQATLTSICNIGVTGLNAVVAPVQNGASAAASAAQQAARAAGLAPSNAGAPGSGGAPGQTGNSGNGPAQQGSAGSPAASSNSPVVGGLQFGNGSSLFSSPFGSASLLDYGLAMSPLSRYGGIPFASAGLFAPSPGVRYGGQVPGYSPQFGVLGQDSTVPSDGVRTAGHAEALGAGAGGLAGNVGLPMLLAVLALAGVTAALVRTWVLRRVRVA